MGEPQPAGKLSIRDRKGGFINVSSLSGAELRVDTGSGSGSERNEERGAVGCVSPLGPV